MVLIIFRFRTWHNFVSITEYYYSVTKLLTKNHSSVSYKFYLFGVVSNLSIRNREVHPYIERLSFRYIEQIFCENDSCNQCLQLSSLYHQLNPGKWTSINKSKNLHWIPTLVHVMDNEKINGEAISALPQ